MQNFRTIKKNGSHEIDIKKSRFICHLKRTETEDEATTFIEEIKKAHWKANHNCSAYIMGERQDIQRAHDDGEPSGTAGVPMLEILKKRELNNVTAVVTRYFGGTKLGAGGLIRAYGGVVNEALSTIGIVERLLHQYITVTVAYPQSGKLENQLRQSIYRLEDIHYTDKVSFECVIAIDQIDTFLEDTVEWTSAQGEHVYGKKAWVEIDVTT
ncbi:YigZ family protein [Marinilactibacillus kalidii]|uniref:YigZ family protein n=1 Tax=Marinilactibacillus kalidii TaxID=2820274 RepID=UPI001ABEBF3C|nr:YigZ family protein [Marinilactibacillus kalidii]